MKVVVGVVLARPRCALCIRPHRSLGFLGGGAFPSQGYHFGGRGLGDLGGVVVVTVVVVIAHCIDAPVGLVRGGKICRHGVT